ncbi:MAG: signal peptidase I [Naasia sp.]
MSLLSAARWAVVALLSAMLVGPALVVHFGELTIVEVTGGSMSPTLEVGDVVLIRPSDAGGLAPGDIVTVQDGSGGYVTHRLQNVDIDGELHLKGDANLFPDADVREASQVLGVLDSIIPSPWGIAMIELQKWPLRISLLVTILGLAFLPLGSSGRSRIRPIASATMDAPLAAPTAPNTLISAEAIR